MDKQEIIDLLNAAGVIEEKKDGLFIHITSALSDTYDEAKGLKLVVDHKRLKEDSYKSILLEAETRGKRVTRKILANKEVTIIFTPREK
ncbi:MAG: hypothetical protein ACYS5F_12215 [Planctomycetota bacterium]|jgi:hypothetical protein